MKTNLLDLALTELREECRSVTVFTTNGFQIKGRLMDFDHYIVVVQSGDVQRFVYRHAISTIQPSGPLDLDGPGEERKP